jgi:hypothetical protein
MKKLIIMTVSLSSLVLFSFIPSNNDGNERKPKIIRLSPHEYAVEYTAGMASADQDKMKEILTKVYGVKDFKEGQVIEFKTQGDAKDKANWWFATNKKWDKDKFTEKAICGKDLKITTEIKELNALLSKYADKNPTGKE